MPSGHAPNPPAAWRPDPDRASTRGALSLLSWARWQGFRLAAVVRRELPRAHVADRPAAAPYDDSRIPPVVYQTWASRWLGRTHTRQVEQFRRLNPQLSFVLFDDEQMIAYMDRRWRGHPIHAVFAGARYPQLATDVFRYCLIYDRGGFYFDISKGLSIPICALLRADATGLIGYEHRLCPAPACGNAIELPDNVVAQWGFGFAAEHPLLADVIEGIVRSYPTRRGQVMPNPKAAILDFTGPDMFTRAVRRHLRDAADPGLVQAGVDFAGSAIWTLKGAYVRFFDRPPYQFVRDDAIVE